MDLLPLLTEYENQFNKLRQDISFPGKEQLLREFKEIDSRAKADIFFGTFGVGNTFPLPNSPFERTRAYELLCFILRNYNEAQYFNIHKGTPYYFIGWTGYEHFDFNKALFYMDAALSEDLRIPEVQNQTETRPSVDFFLLNEHSVGSARSAHDSLNKVVTDTINDFNNRSPATLHKSDFIEKFIRKLLFSGPAGRSVITAFYNLLLEFGARRLEIKLRSSASGSIQPFLDHLFDGARILESLLENSGGTGSTLRPKLLSFPSLAINSDILFPNQTLADAEGTYIRLLASNSPFQDCNFSAAYIIRNTTGHSLLWPDQFGSSNSFKTLYNCLVDSILWTIIKLWC